MAKSPKKPNVSSTLPSVYDYLDYRVYLADFYARRKASERGYSFRAFSLAAGFSSPNILKLVIDGKRNIGRPALVKFSKALGLTGPEAAFFSAMVQMNQAATDAEKLPMVAALHQLLPHAKKRQLPLEGLQYLSHWLYPVLREMTLLPEFRDDPYWLGRRLHGTATVSEIAAAWQFLVKEGFVEKQAGTYKPTDHLVLSSDEVRSLGIRNYHRQMLEQAKEALVNLPLEEREFGALIVILPETAIPELKAKMKNFRRELHEWALAAANASAGEAAGAPSASQVVQLNMQMYPHTKRVLA